MNRLATALLVLAVIAGPPLLVGVWLLHHPWQPPTRAQIVAWTGRPLTASTIIGGCLAIAGLIWLLLLIHLTRRALARLRRRLRRWRHLPVPTPAQMTAGSMAGLAAFTLPATPAEHPQPLPAVPGTPQPSDSADSGDHDDRSAQTRPAGIALPGGGWIPYRTAVAITALAAAAWLQRRRSYRPDPRKPRDHHDDPDLQPLPGAIHTIAAAVSDDQRPATDHRSPPLLAQPLPEGILQLTGPGAAAATRGILITAALSDTISVSVRPDHLHLLLPAEHRAGAPGASIAAHASNRSDAHARTDIVLDDDPAATHRWYVTIDGTATGTGLTEPHRLCILDPRTTIDLLALADLRRHAEPPDLQSASATGQPTIPTPEPAAATQAVLTLLGGSNLTVAGKPVHLRRTAGLQILAYLAVHPEGASRKDLIHALWPHLPATTISQRFHTTLTALRQQLRPLLNDDPITRHDDLYQLNTRAITADLHQWRTAVHAMTHAIDTTIQHRACQDIVDLYRGELAAGHTWPWLTPAREQTRRTVIDACTTLADHTNPDNALHWLQHATTIDPYNETVHHHATLLLNASGDTVGAAAAIERMHLRFADQPFQPPRTNK